MYRACLQPVNAAKYNEQLISSASTGSYFDRVGQTNCKICLHKWRMLRKLSIEILWPSIFSSFYLPIYISITLRT